jgi:hypothetical protein
MFSAITLSSPVVVADWYKANEAERLTSPAPAALSPASVLMDWLAASWSWIQPVDATH